MARKRGFVPESPCRLEELAVPSAYVPPYLSLTSYNQAVLDVQGAFGAYQQTENLVINNYGPLATLYQNIEHAIRPIPYHKLSGLDATVQSIMGLLKSQLSTGGAFAIGAAENEVLFALKATVDNLSSSGAIRRGGPVTGI